jgi:hypothetical protein
MAAANEKLSIRVTPLNKLKRTGKVLQGPINALNVQFSSWVEDAFRCRRDAFSCTALDWNGRIWAI